MQLRFIYTYLFLILNQVYINLSYIRPKIPGEIKIELFALSAFTNTDIPHLGCIIPCLEPTCQWPVRTTCSSLDNAAKLVPTMDSSNVSGSPCCFAGRELVPQQCT